MRKLLLVFSFVTLLSPAVFAAGGHGVDGASLSVLFVIPFACMLLSIALGPILVPSFWHHHFGKVAVGWAIVFLIPFAIRYGANVAVYEVLHILLLDYIPFIILLFSLFTVAGGVQIKGSFVGKPVVNTVILLIGTCLASLMGTTGAAMLFIRPILRANAHRKNKVHTVVFFIFMVANVGGSLTPLGDPPLFLGFLKGVPFMWTFTHLLVPTLMVVAALAVVYFIIDTIMYNKEGKPVPADMVNEKFGLGGKVNLLLLAGVVLSVLMSGTWKPNFSFLTADGSVIFIQNLTNISMSLPNIIRDILLLTIAGVSLKITPKSIREANDFNWEPILEVAKLFVGIFLTMIPALAILNAGKDGALGSVVSLVTTADGQHIPYMYFFVTGGLSSFLDNAPTYLVFFTLAGGLQDVQTLITTNAHILLAISCGAVYMGANTYIGNAPNFMVRPIAESQGVKMPSFFGYMAWSMCILMPILIIISLIFFRMG